MHVNVEKIAPGNTIGLTGEYLGHGGSAVVTTAGTRVALPSTVCKAVLIYTKSTNTGSIFIGPITVDNTDIPFPKETLLRIPVQANANEIYLDSSVNGEGVNWQPIISA